MAQERGDDGGDGLRRERRGGLLQSESPSDSASRQTGFLIGEPTGQTMVIHIVPSAAFSHRLVGGEDREGTRPHRPGQRSRARRRGDRIGGQDHRGCSAGALQLDAWSKARTVS